MSHDHGHGHDHGGHAHAHGGLGGIVNREVESGRLKWVLVITGVFMVAEAVGGYLAGSLTLLADAGHMLTDAGSLALSLFAMRMAQKPASPEKTYGYVRTEILAALINGATLLVISGLIVVEAWRRLRSPVEVNGTVLLGIAVAGLAVNLLGAYLLHSHAGENLNMRGAYLHVLGDLLGSVGAIAAGVVILLTGWMPVDPIVSIIIAALILHSSWKLVREATDVLMEAAPRDIAVEDVVQELRDIDGLDDVHDVHVWTLTSGFVALSAHGVIDDPGDHMRILEEIQDRMRERGIEHVTFQVELRPLYQLPHRGNRV